jgi:hypothetical protein
MTAPSSWITELSGRLLVWSNRRGSVFEALAAVLIVATVLAWLLGFTDVRSVVEALGAAVLLWGVGAILRQTLGP